jgi:hypothetical protein
MAEIDIIRLDILENHQMTKSWKITGDLFGINKASARLIAVGRDPGDNVQKQLKLSTLAYVIAIDGCEVPPGSQVIGARQCGCGKWFIANSGKRVKCYECNKPRIGKVANVQIS